jgi:hypothetical protein
MYQTTLSQGTATMIPSINATGKYWIQVLHTQVTQPTDAFLRITCNGGPAYSPSKQLRLVFDMDFVLSLQRVDPYAVVDATTYSVSASVPITITVQFVPYAEYELSVSAWQQPITMNSFSWVP